MTKPLFPASHVRLPTSMRTDDVGATGGPQAKQVGAEVKGTPGAPANDNDADVFGRTPADTPTTLPTHGGTPSKTGAVHLRMGQSSSTLSTMGSRLAQLGRKLTASLLPPPGSEKRKVVQSVVAAGFMFVFSLAPQAQTIYVNVNGAKVTSAEYIGAKQAAANANEAFIAIKPKGLEAEFQRAEAGGEFRKFIVSGHSGGTWVTGRDDEGSNSLSLAEVQGMTQRFPAAAAKVELFFGMACNIGTEAHSRHWMSLFPNAKALVGFDHIGPSTTRQAAKDVLVKVDHELSKVDFSKLDRDKALKLGERLSKLPGVNQTEFAIRLRANDGTTVFYSKLNKPTDVTLQRDITAGLRDTAFLPYLEARSGFENPPTGHGSDNPVRQFYNASHDLLSSMTREAERVGNHNIADEPAYQAAEADKEKALKLVYFHTLLANAEVAQRPMINEAMAELASYGLHVTMPKLQSMTRAEVIGWSKGDVFRRYHLNDWNHRHRADIAVVEGFLASKGSDVKVPTFTRNEYAAAVMFHRQDTALKEHAAPAEVMAALTRLKQSVEAPAGQAKVNALQDFLQKGLVDLEPEMIPVNWITDEPRS
jgi:hypothetical protein